MIAAVFCSLLLFHLFHTVGMILIFLMSKSSHRVCINPSLELWFLYNFVLTNNFDFASLLINLLVLVYFDSKLRLIQYFTLYSFSSDLIFSSCFWFFIWNQMNYQNLIEVYMLDTIKNHFVWFHVMKCFNSLP